MQTWGICIFVLFEPKPNLDMRGAGTTLFNILFLFSWCVEDKCYKPMRVGDVASDSNVCPLAQTWSGVKYLNS